MERLIEKGAIVNKSDKNGTSPMYVTCQEEHTDIIKIILRYKADVYLCNEMDICRICQQRLKIAQRYSMYTLRTECSCWWKLI